MLTLVLHLIPPTYLNAEVAIDALYSPLFYRLLLKHQPLTDEFVDELVDLVTEGIIV